MATLNIKLLPKQQEIFQNKARFKIISCGRRFGKTVLSSFVVILAALAKPDQTFFILSPNYAQTKILWRMIKRTLPKQAIRRIMEGELYIELHNGSMIFAKSGDNPDALRGEGLDGCVLDECAMLKPEVWNEAIRPALADKNGWAIFISCITPNTYICTPQGITRYSDVVNIINMERVPIPCKLDVFGKDGFNTTEFSWENGLTETIKITIEGGYKLEGTLNHPIWAKKTKYQKIGSWIELRNVNKDSYAALQLNQQIFGNDNYLHNTYTPKRKPRSKTTLPNEVNTDFAYLIGLLIGDGYIGKRDIAITSQDKEIIDFCNKKPFGLHFSKAHLGNGTYHLRAGSDELINILSNLGIERVKAKNKTIPKKCFAWSKENICSLLQGLFDTDGYSTIKHIKNYDSRPKVGFVTSSGDLIEQVRILLLNLGITSTIDERPVEPTKKVKVHSYTYSLQIADQIGVSRFKDQIGFRINRKMEKLTVKPGKVYGDHRRIYEKHPGYEIKWCRVKKIEPSKAKTYDLHIPNGHNFFTNGFISHNTPKGKNWFYELFLRGLDETQNEFKSFQYPSWANPLLKPTEIEEMRKSMPEISFRQEVMAEFLDSGGAVFRGLDQVLTSMPEDPVPGEFYMIGVDLGRHEDFTIIKVGKLSEHREVYRERFNQSDWDYIKERIRTIYNKYNKGCVIMDSTGYGDPIYEDLSKEGLNINGINMNVSTKPMLIENLQLMIENKQISLINDPNLTLEFGAYTYTILPSGNVRYEAAKGFHDDEVVSTALMAIGMQGGGTQAVGVVEPFDEEKYGERVADYDDLPEVIEWDELEEYEKTKHGR